MTANCSPMRFRYRLSFLVVAPFSVLFSDSGRPPMVRTKLQGGQAPLSLQDCEKIRLMISFSIIFFFLLSSTLAQFRASRQAPVGPQWEPDQALPRKTFKLVLHILHTRVLSLLSFAFPPCSGHLIHDPPQCLRRHFLTPLMSESDPFLQ